MPRWRCCWLDWSRILGPIWRRSWTSLGILWLHDRANAPLFVVVSIFVVIVVTIPSGVLWMKQWADRLPAIWLRRLPGTALLLRAIAEAPTDLLRNPVLLGETVSLEFAVFALDALTLWLAFRALGDTPAIWVPFVSFIMASMAATLGPIPLGLGTFEAACVAMLSLLGVAIEAALAATLSLLGRPDPSILVRIIRTVDQVLHRLRRGHPRQLASLIISAR
jgi:glycosyltransferase 2 family protein